MTESDHEKKELKRKRPKTHWIWYIGTISASLVVGLGIAYAIQVTDKAAVPIPNEKSDILLSSTHTKLQTTIPVHQKPTLPVEANEQVNTVTVEKSESPKYASIPNKQDSTNPQPKQKTRIETTHTNKPINKPSNPSKPNPNNGSKPQPPKETPPPKNPNPPEEHPPSPPSVPDNHKGPIVRIVDHVTNTVHYLLTGKTNK
ncbi:hypothetical protein [Shimazuella kribbensis]|uniref:hypothetical protein n=1 Tax=Shimazuella kribbensis TaxID=139808 RepID=UPI0003FCDD0F|nr:hypothetical protein [Shimazuella kribbensis]